MMAPSPSCDTSTDNSLENALLPEWLTLEILHILSRALEAEFSGYPAGCCEYVAGKVEGVLGFPRQSGVYVDQHGNGHPHAWNLDPLHKQIIDLTVSQFNPELKPVSISASTDEEGAGNYLAGLGFGF